MEFCTADEMRRAFAIQDTFNALEIGIENIDKRIFPGSFVEAYKILKKDHKTIWQNMIEGKAPAYFTSLTRDIPLEHDEKTMVSVKKQIVDDSERYGKQTEIWVKKVFGFELPKKLYIVLDIRERKGRHGLCVEQDPPLIALQFRQDDGNQTFFPVVIHEFLHILMAEAKIWNNEALLDYFVPSGMLAYELGIKKRLPLDELHENNVRDRPGSRDMSKRLLPVMKEYEKNFGKQTIWDFLSENGFGNDHTS